MLDLETQRRTAFLLSFVVNAALNWNPLFAYFIVVKKFNTVVFIFLYNTVLITDF